MRADMGGESRTQAAMRKRVTHRHVPVYVLPKDIMRTATATSTTVSRNPYNMLRTFLSHDSNLSGLVSPRKNNSSTAYHIDAFFFSRREKIARLAKLACNRIIFNFVNIFIANTVACKFIYNWMEWIILLAFFFNYNLVYYHMNIIL